MAAPEQFEFGPFRLDLGRRELLAHGAPVTLGQRAFDVLVALVRRRGGLVTKDELLAEVWPRLVVEENNLQVQVSALRKIFQAADGGERYLVTVPGRGYRFVAPVRHADGPTGTHGEARSVAAPPPRERPRVDLPQSLSELIGREADLETVRSRLAAHRLVTLTGAGGVGKTRLAIEVGRAVASRFADGVCLAELAPLGEKRLVFSVIAEALRANAAGASAGLDRLADALEGRELLLILDNCEHVLVEASRVVETLLRACPRLHVLASSRERLGIVGESVYRVPSLPAPASDLPLDVRAAREFPAVRLFEERAAALGTGFALTDANAEMVGAISRRLDGIPLAIELAAPRLKVLSLTQLAESLDDRLALLTTGARTAPPRHQTLQALIDWSYQLLTTAEKLFVRRFAVFAGSAALDGVKAVVADGDIAPGEVLDLLASLVEKSLILADTAGGEPRYRMLESIRIFMRAQFTGESEIGARRRHARLYADRVAAAGAAWETTPSAQWTAAYERDVDDVRAALAWAFGPGGDPALGLELAGGSHVLWSELGLVLEHRHWIEEALRRHTRTTPRDVTARVLSWQAGEVRDMDDPADRTEGLRAAKIYRQLGDRFAEGRMLLRAGEGQLLPDVAEGERLLRKARALLIPAGATKSLARCLSALATARLLAGDAAAARKLHAEAVAIYRNIGDAVG
ncbi:MAG TPA: winged helix-turn-helix domain-containing protein [Xanthobacteraceae bacterium]|nr:winged helix-turn-helix domain-containing protein [Xanthobacteraceae bacterium]